VEEGDSGAGIVGVMVAVAVAEGAGVIVIGLGRGVGVPTVEIAEGKIDRDGGGVLVIRVIRVGVRRLRGDGVGRGLRRRDGAGIGV
jgi:hypothetical protein